MPLASDPALGFLKPSPVFENVSPLVAVPGDNTWHRWELSHQPQTCRVVPPIEFSADKAPLSVS